MDIQQAIIVVHGIDEKLDSMDQFVDSGYLRNGNVEMCSGNWSIKLNDLFSNDDRIALFERERERLKTKRAKLVSVIDMANAALKGIGA